MTTAAIEALATGLPAITTTHSGFPDQIHDGKNGFMVPEGDWKALADKILYYIDHEELWGPFGAYGRELMLQNYDSKKLIDTQVDMYRSILQKQKLSTG